MIKENRTHIGKILHHKIVDGLSNCKMDFGIRGDKGLGNHISWDILCHFKWMVDPDDGTS